MKLVGGGSLVRRRHGFEAWRVLKDEYKGKCGNRMAALLKGILNPRPRWEKMYSEGRDAVKNCRRRRSQVATVMEHAPVAYRGLLKMVPLANRAHVRELSLTQRTCDDLGLQVAHDTSAPMDIGQAKGVKGKAKKGKKGKRKGKDKDEKDNGKAKGCAQMTLTLLAGVGTLASGDTKAQEGRVQEAEERPRRQTSGLNGSSGRDGEPDPIWRGRFILGAYARILVGSGADHHVCPTNFASPTPLKTTKNSSLCGAQGHMIEAHGTKTVYMRLGRQGQCVDAEFRVTNVKSPILSMKKLVKQGYQFEAGPTGCKMSKGDRSLTWDVVKNSLWVDVRAYTTAEGARNADARLVAPVVSELPVEPSSSSGPTTQSFQTARAPRGSSGEYLDKS